MPKYQIEMNGQTFEVEAADENALKGALGKLQEMSAEKPVDVGNQRVGASDVYTDEMLFGLPGKAASGLNAVVQRGIAALPGESPWEDKSVGELYSTNRDQYNNSRKKYAEDHPVINTLASVGGAIHGASTIGRAAGPILGAGGKAVASYFPSAAPLINATLNSANSVATKLGGSYAGRMLMGTASGAAQGAAAAYGHDQDIGTGSLVGGVAGGLSRPVIDAGGAVVRSIGGLVGVGNQGRANAAIAEALARSGKSVDDIADDLARAAQDGQPEYMVADAMGNSGQRMLTGVARSPGDMRQTIAEALQRRQAGQGRRLQNAMTEGFGAPQTQRQTEAALEALRKADASVNFEDARQAAGAVDPTAAIARADQFLGTGGSLPLTNIADDSVEGTVRRARAMLTDGQNIVSDFGTAFRTKVELQNIIEKASPSIQREIIPIKNELDKALELASKPYAQARDTFRQQSQNIEAANIGREASKAGRVEDNIDMFAQMARPEQQQAFRAGYVDPQIASIQNAAGPMTNKARPLLTDATQAEFPAFAKPGEAPRLMDRLNREQRMFETANTALGGSRTADNLSDIADVQSFDPTMLGVLLSGNLKGAALQGLQRGINSLQGRNSQTRDMMARMLMEADPNVAREILRKAADSGKKLTKAQEALGRALISGGATQPFRLLQGQ